MYYDEQVINGVLCHRGSPDGEWIPFTLESLTVSLIAMRGQVEDRDRKIERLKTALDKITDALLNYD